MVSRERNNAPAWLYRAVVLRVVFEIIDNIHSEQPPGSDLPAAFRMTSREVTERVPQRRSPYEGPE